MSQGKYVMSEESGLGVIIRKNVKAIKGGYSQFSEGTDVSVRDIDAYVTVISGDVNGNKQADAGDCWSRKGLSLLKELLANTGMCPKRMPVLPNVGVAFT